MTRLFRCSPPVAVIGSKPVSNVVSGLALGLALLGAGLLGAFLGPSNPAQAEEYMKRGASVDDYQQALGRVLERKRGIVTARERQQRAAAARPAPHAATGTGTGTQVARPQTSSTSRPAGIDTGVYSPTTDQEDDTSNGLSLYFGYNSAELTAAARDELRKLGQALSAPEFAQVYWLIEGHTDATGAADYNQQLSEARAASARRFLIEQGGIAPDQLITVGKGESELYDAQHPTASVNRRVRLRPIGEDRQPSPTDATAPSAEDAG